MPAKKPIRRRAHTITAQDAFSGLSGFWKHWTQFGINGVVAGVMVYAVTVMLPAQIDKHDNALKDAREQGFAHGEKAVDKLVTGMDRLGEKFGAVQSTTQSKQDKIITGIEETNACLKDTNTILRGQQRVGTASPPATPFEFLPR